MVVKLLAILAVFDSLISQIFLVVCNVEGCELEEVRVVVVLISYVPLDVIVKTDGYGMVFDVFTEQDFLDICIDVDHTQSIVLPEHCILIKMHSSSQEEIPLLEKVGYIAYHVRDVLEIFPVLLEIILENLNDLDVSRVVSCCSGSVAATYYLVDPLA